MDYDVIIIGGGIVGLATGLKLKEKKPGVKLAILEKEAGVAMHQTGNNSGVIHAGVYYKPGSLKALNCLRGYQMLLDFCNREDINYELCGKLIVVTREKEMAGLEDLYQRALQNGLQKVRKIPKEEIKAFEPHATGLSALHVPYTGIVNFRDVAEKYAEIIKNRYQGDVLLSQEVINIKYNRSGKAEVITKDRSYTAKLVVNTAGLFSDKIAALTRNNIQARIIPFRGEYSVLIPEKRYLVKGLIYPVPDLNFPFLGVHFTKKIDGSIEAGPNAVWAFKREGYKFSDFSFTDVRESLAWKGFRKVMWQYWRMGLGEYWRSFSKPSLVKALQRLVPELQLNDIIHGGAGVRAQACDKYGGLIDDFLIVEDHYMINVLNAPSPAATASLSIGDTLAEKILKHLS
ncbi:MAG: L-2-hydroxyglutarate oxidase [Bacteroidales bacterium]|nr:L-2-hydroxyglutarate oxidase [Bacteroidales bacterium]